MSQEKKKASQKIMEKIESQTKTLTEHIKKLSSEKPDIITVEDAKVLKQHLDTCTEPNCPYRPIFTPKTKEPPKKQGETSKEPPESERWKVSDIGKES